MQFEYQFQGDVCLLTALCVSAPKSGPHVRRLQLIDPIENSALRWGSQSAPIGTPLKEQLLKCYQRIAPGAAGVPFRSAMTIIRMYPKGTGPNWTYGTLDPMPTRAGLAIAQTLVASVYGRALAD
jgi:hypothetical protein